MSLRVGFARETITPALDRPVYLAGFGQNRLAEGVHDDLYASALALQHGETRLALVGLDLIGLARQHCLEIQRRVAEESPGTRIIVACTHVHHGPDTLGLWGPDQATSGVDPEYLLRVKDAAVAAALRALSATRPAFLKAAGVHVPPVAKNARDPEIFDDELTCLQLVAPAPEGGAALATLLVFPCHPETLWRDNHQITSDYPASLRREVERATGAPCLFLAGALGGMMTPNVTDHSFEEAEWIGRELAGVALQALGDAYADEVGLIAHASREFAVPMANPLFRAAMAAGLLPSAVDPMGDLVTEASLVRVGSVWLATAPGELLPALGLLLKTELEQAGAGLAGVVGLANDELGYILPREDFIYPEDPYEPGKHYEETMSVGPEAGPRLIEAARSLIADVSDA